jgi:hypothetical protein
MKTLEELGIRHAKTSAEQQYCWGAANILDIEIVYPLKIRRNEESIYPFVGNLTVLAVRDLVIAMMPALGYTSKMPDFNLGPLSLKKRTT